MPSSYRKYAVDFNGNHKTDLLNEPTDAIGSVGNYLQGYGWVKGGLVAVRATVMEEVCVGATNSPRSMAEWREAGVMAEMKISPDTPARLLDFTLQDGKEFWLGFNNFDVITRYNNSDFYAMSVFQLAEALKAAHQEKH
jgi:membrane-bound lytic murein transglycosylase B